jgi:DNA-dependent RNA polymerase auxiliary subunit epsilon
MIENNFKNQWLIFLNIVPKNGLNFNELVDSESDTENYDGAWANVLIKAETINEALEILPRGLSERDFDIEFVDKIENVSSLFEYDELNEIVLSEAKWLEKSNYVFKISDKIFPYNLED